MTGPFIELTEPETGRSRLVNVALVAWVAPHGRTGSFIYFTGDTERMQVEEAPSDVSALIRDAGVICQGRREDSETLVPRTPGARAAAR